MDGIEVESMMSFQSLSKRSCQKRLFVDNEEEIRSEAKVEFDID
jgi:hypothetical protein